MIGGDPEVKRFSYSFDSKQTKPAYAGEIFPGIRYRWLNLLFFSDFRGFCEPRPIYCDRCQSFGLVFAEAYDILPQRLGWGSSEVNRTATLERNGSF